MKRYGILQSINGMYIAYDGEAIKQASEHYPLGDYRLGVTTAINHPCLVIEDSVNALLWVYCLLDCPSNYSIVEIEQSTTVTRELVGEV